MVQDYIGSPRERKNKITLDIYFVIILILKIVVTPRPIETPVTRYKRRINVIVTPVNGRFAKKVSLRRPYQVRILLFLCLQINISAKVKSLIGGEMICFSMYVSM